MVPMIAMDELPIHVQIEGVQRTLSALEVGGMTGVGFVEARHQVYTVKSMNNTKPISLMPADLLTAPNSATSTPILPATKLVDPFARKPSIVDLIQTTDVSFSLQKMFRCC